MIGLLGVILAPSIPAAEIVTYFKTEVNTFMDKEKSFDELYLEKLLQERDDINKIIEAIQRKIGGTITPTEGMSSSGGIKGSQQIHHDTFFGMSIVDAAKKYLKMVGKPARTTVEIVEVFERGGIKTSATTLSSILSRADRQEQGICHPGRGTWGLPEWYPGTSRRSSKSADKEELPEEAEGKDDPADPK